MRRTLIRSFFALFVLAVGSAPASAFETEAREAVVMDFNTGTLLFEKNAREAMPPASMTKLMTAYVIFDRLKNGDLSMDDTFVVSEKAWRKGGSKMFVEVGNEVSVENLLQGMIVQSGNDASIVLAEGIAGSEDAFADIMNDYAEKLDMPATNFENATGWPDPEHRTSALGLVRLARALIANFPDYYERFYDQLEFTWNGIRQYNRNPLLRRNMGVDGLKTGYTRNAGYGLTASAMRDGRRVITVVNGLDRPSGRENESARLIEWAFREFKNVVLFEAGETVEQAEVWLGSQPSVPLVSEQRLEMTLPADATDSMTVTLTYEAPIPAPIEAGEQLATLTIEAPSIETRTIPLKAGETVPQLGTFGRIVSGVEYLVFGAP
ncbi:D-alanyl-D-alanine carboxypeptidase family protein [Rhodovibrio salinarum]|uniref:serine-type D-Ala-D-Ala carboxypeptidase n=1 Tax=Rhodovibrio salinarum TaxID=1087 RepID=A0A934QJF4_9PROT|nr:D-alanyl-D-alanine carboxypeptidase family protein [Rhodovibrio salinarum]MBK1697987.1 D-alanyl-D-alanine carboxypeptidase [Rhodovibrio salinarum]